MLLLSIMKLVLALPKTLYILPWCLPINCPEATTDAAQWHSWKRITTLRSLEAGSGQKGGADGVSGRANSNCTQVTFLVGDKKEKPAIIFVKKCCSLHAPTLYFEPLQLQGQNVLYVA